MASYAENKKPTATFNSDGHRQYTRYFRVITDNATDGPIRANQVLGINEGEPYIHNGEIDLNALAKKITPKPVKNKRTHWDITVRYDTKQTPGEENPDDNEDNPLNRRPKLSVRPLERLVVVREDNEGKPLQNACGEPLPYDYEKPVGYPLLTIKKNYASFDIDQLSRFYKAIDSDGFLGLEAGRSMMHNIEATEDLTENGVPYVELTMEVAINKVPWNPVKLENKGYMAFINFDASGKVIAPSEEPHYTVRWPAMVLGQNGLPTMEHANAEVWLNANGYQWFGGNLEGRIGRIEDSDGDPEEEKYIERNLHDEQPFGELRIFG